jgi:hypothetical protein
MIVDLMLVDALSIFRVALRGRLEWSAPESVA